MKDYTKAEQLYFYFYNATGINIFENTRKRKHIEARAVINYVLYNVHKYGLSEIAEFYKNHRKRYDHATVYHSLNNFDMYNFYSKDMQEWLVILEDYAKGDIKRSLCKSLLNELGRDDVDFTYNYLKNKFYKQRDERTNNNNDAEATEYAENYDRSVSVAD
jgi:hypothetical protein